MKKTGEKTILDGKGVERVLTRLTHEILEKNRGASDIVLVGVALGGVPLSKAIRRIIKAIEGIEVPAGYLDITLYRDDLGKSGYQTRLKKTEIPFSIDEKRVILVDDVLYTGRTIRAAMDALVDLGRPRERPRSGKWCSTKGSRGRRSSAWTGDGNTSWGFPTSGRKRSISSSTPPGRWRMSSLAT
jgi:pyrimidine operon attenuation protein/uracil phosphoribosyltransferase